jgi:LysM repeat protein
VNSLKNLFFLAILAVVGWGVYVSIMRSPEPAGAPPPGAPEAPPVAPKVEIPGPLSGMPPLPTAGRATAPAAGDMAPPFVAPGPTSAAPAGGAAPPFVPPGPAATPAGGSSPAAGSLPSVTLPPPGVVLSGTTLPYASSTPPSAGATIALTTSGSTASVPSPSATGATGAVQAHGSDAREKIFALLDTVQAKVEDRKLAEAHLLLSSLCHNSDMPIELTRSVNESLDQMAGTVIYSRQHLLEPAYVVQPGDTLERIAATYRVPAQLLARINGIRDPDNLRPGHELKVVKGPFSAVVSLGKFELMLMLQDRYAGRFPIGLGTDHPPTEGTYTVQAKQVNPAYQGPAGLLEPGNPNNPLGRFSIDLGGGIAIHGSNDAHGIRRPDNHGSICLSDHDIDDVFGILSVGSRVTIER